MKLEGTFCCSHTAVCVDLYATAVPDKSDSGIFDIIGAAALPRQKMTEKQTLTIPLQARLADSRPQNN